MSGIGLFLRFLLGGLAVAASAIIGRKLGGRIGGIFAAFPAVYASAIISIAVNLPSDVAKQQVIKISNGALAGMIVNIGCAFVTGLLVNKYGWKKGLLFALSSWMMVILLVFSAGKILGWLH